MSTLKLPLARLPEPVTYRAFLCEMKEFVAEKGLAWSGGDGWDVRALTGGFERHARNLKDFRVLPKVRAAILEGGYAPASVPHGEYLSDDASDFIKAIVASRAKAGVKAHSAANTGQAARYLLSSTNKAPWELNTEDFERLFSVWPKEADILRLVQFVASMLNRQLLSVNCPLTPVLPMTSKVDMANHLAERSHSEKLPDKEALLELTRILFQEKPRNHRDEVCFSALQISVVTGLRIKEVLMLPRDCLVWREYVDVITGRPAGEVGGVSKSLGLRYFKEKTKYSGDALVEGIQWVPARFQEIVVKAVERALEATRELSKVLRRQHQAPDQFSGSDLRKFKSNEGTVLDTADLLFLVVTGSVDLPSPGAQDARISPLLVSTIDRRLGNERYRDTPSIFQTYGDHENAASMRIETHALRHMMNTEYFRLHLPDTIITHQFGRTSVAQSYEYDHRSLSEKLDFVSLPAAASALVQKGTVQELVAKMVVSGAMKGSHLAESFSKIQAGHGDKAAFEYLVANSDGFHVTPYGFCTNSFSVNPCARHLKCFDNCRHFAASGKAEHRVSLVSLREKLVAMRQVAERKPALTVGRRNQVASAERLIIGVEKALAVQPNELVFPRGVDHSAPTPDLFK